MRTELDGKGEKKKKNICEKWPKKEFSKMFVTH